MKSSMTQATLAGMIHQATFPRIKFEAGYVSFEIKL